MLAARSRGLGRRLISTALVLAALGIPLQAEETQSNATETTVTIQPLSDRDLGYDLMHLEIVAVGEIASEGSGYGYRVLHVTEQGNCVGMCPASILYVLVGKVSAKRDEEKVKVYRIDGVRFMHFPKVTTLNPEENGGFFLALRFISMPHPDQPQHYIARVGAHGAMVERDGPDIPPPAHRFGQLLHRRGSGVFRIRLRDGNVFRLQDFEIFDPKAYGQPDGWSATVVESDAANLPAYRMKPGSHFGPFVEPDIMEIFDESLNEVVYSR